MLGRQDSVLGSVIEGNLGELAAALDDTSAYRENLERRLQAEVVFLRSRRRMETIIMWIKLLY